MALSQVTVFIENKEGRLEKVTEILKKNAIDIISLSLAESVDFGILRFIVSEPEKTRQVLRDAGSTVKLNHVVGVEVNNKPGALFDLLTLLHDFNIEYMYVLNADEKASMILRIKDYEDAEALLNTKGYKILSQKDLARGRSL